MIIENLKMVMNKTQIEMLQGKANVMEFNMGK